MICRRALISDLTVIQAMVSEVVIAMNSQGINIWDEVYPNEFFSEDIRQQRLYVLENEGEIVAVFALNDENSGEKHVQWHYENGKSMVIDRLAVNVHHARKGIGMQALRAAMKEAKRMGADCLRLFVVENNLPAIKLYEKAGFLQADGVYVEVLDDSFSLNEIGYEICLKEIVGLS